MELNIFGAYDSRDLAGVSLADYTEERAIIDLRAFTEQYAAAFREVISPLAEFDTIAQANYGSEFGGELQPYVEAGETEATRTLEPWSVGFPIYRYRDRQIYTEERLITMTLEDLNKDVLAAATRDYQTMVKSLLRAVMRKTNYNFTDGIFPGSNLGTIAVKRLCNADSATGAVYVNGSEVAIAALQHYYGSNAAAIAIAAFTTGYAKLKAVGRTADVVAYVADGNVDTIRGFTEFVATNNTLIVDPAKKYALVQSPKAIGRLEGTGISCEVVVMPFMPTGYFMMVDRADTKPLKIREHKIAGYRGFRLVQDETRAAYGEASLRNKRWERIAGVGVYNRVNGICCQVVESTTTYTDPSTI